MSVSNTCAPTSPTVTLTLEVLTVVEDISVPSVKSAAAIAGYFGTWIVVPATLPMSYRVTRPAISEFSSAVKRAAAMMELKRSVKVELVVAAMIVVS